MTNTQETKELASIDTILRNLKEDPEYYNHGGMTEAKWLEECNRED